MNWDNNTDGPWGQRGSNGRRPPPDMEEWIERLQQRLNRFLRGSWGSGSGLALIGLVLVGVWLASGIYRVLPDEQGVVTRFGAFDRTTASGLHYHLPYPIEAVLTPKVTIINRADVGMRVFSESAVFGIGRSSDSLRDIPEESLMLTGDENIVDVDFSVFWVIEEAPDFLFNIQNPIGTVRAVAESTMREVIGKNKLQPVLTGDRQRVEEDVKVLMQKTLDNYGAGISITQVKMQKVDPPSAVIDSFRDVQAARADQERARNEAMAYGNRVVPEARGEAAKLKQDAEAYRERIIAESEGEALRFLAVYNEYRSAPEVTRRRLFLESMERVLEKSDKIILDPKNNSGVVPYLPLDRLQKKGAGQ